MELKSSPDQIIFFVDLQCFVYQENVDGFLLLSKLKTVENEKKFIQCAFLLKPKSVIRLWGDCPLVSCSMLLA